MGRTMDERMLRVLVEAGAVRAVRIVADAASLHVEAHTQSGAVTASTRRGRVRTWRSLDSAARWTRGLGVGRVEVDMARWRPTERRLPATG